MFQGGSGGASRPLTVAYVDAGATSEFNLKLDAYRPQDATELNVCLNAPKPTEELSTKAFPAFGAGLTLPLTVRVPEPGEYALRPLAVNQLPEGLAAFLDDTLTGKSVNLADKAGYSFTVEDTAEATPLTDRFVLRFE